METGTHECVRYDENNAGASAAHCPDRRTSLRANPCDGTPAYSPCEMVFELSAADLAAHPNPYVDVQLQAEFKSPQFHTYAMPAFWDGGRKMIVRFTPTEAGQWSYRTTSNLAAFDGKEGAFNAAPSESPGYVKAANVHHWATDNKKPHLMDGLHRRSLRIQLAAGAGAEAQ